MTLKDISEIVKKVFPDLTKYEIHTITRIFAVQNEQDSQKMKAIIDLVAMSK